MSRPASSSKGGPTSGTLDLLASRVLASTVFRAQKGPFGLGVKYVGLDPLTVLTCATRTGAEILGREKEIGTLEAGKLADVLVVDGDVLADISVLEDRSRIVAVMQGGVVKAGRLTRPA